ALDPIIADLYVKTGQTNELIERTRTYLLDILEQAKQQFLQEGLSVETKLLEGFVVHEEIIQAAQELNADLIVMGSHGRTGVRKLVLGSVAQKVLGESHIPVLIVR
ncbi:universal stress protein, partial [Acinetobacter baumannii]